MLQCTDLSFAYDGVMRLSGVNITLKPGCLLALFGHNGSGKSTLLKMLGGSLPVRAGTVSFREQSALHSSGYLRHDLRKQIGVLFQTTSSDEKLSVIDNLIFSARLYGLSHAHALRKAHEAVAHASLTERANVQVKKLSLGTRRRLELYRCFMHEPKLLLLDEPTAGLDVASVKKFFSFINDYKDKHQAAIILATHQADELLFADELLMMSEGKVLAEGRPTAMLGELNYLRASLVLDNNDHSSIKFHRSDLPTMLPTLLLQGGSFKSLSIEKPSLADVYQDLVQGTHHVQ